MDLPAFAAASSSLVSLPEASGQNMKQSGIENSQNAVEFKKITLLNEAVEPRFNLISVRTLPTISRTSCPFKALRTCLPFIASRVAR
jgi:hypothetical protein